MLIIGIVSATSLLVSFSSFFEDEESNKIVGITTWSSSPEYNKNIKSFQKTLEDYGYVEGKNIQYIIKNPNADKSQQKKIIQELIDKKVDVIYSLTTPGTIIVKEMTKDIPVVFSIVTYPVRADLIESFESSGNNLVGVSNYIDIQKQFQLIYDIFPHKKIGFVHKEGEVNSLIQIYEMKQFAQTYNVEVIEISVKNLDDAKSILNLAIEDVDVLYNACDTLVQNGLEEISIEMASNRNKPVFSCNEAGIHAGALAGNAVNLEHLGSIAAKKTYSILQGDLPTDLSSEKQRLNNIVINSKSSQNLGIEFPKFVTTISQTDIREELN